MPANIDITYRIDLLRALAYLFAHPEIESHVELVWNPVDDPPGQVTFKFAVDAQVMEATLIRLKNVRGGPR